MSLIKPKRNPDKTYFFKDYPEFNPNLSPSEIFQLGSFGGTYWRSIYSRVTKKHYKDQHKKYPPAWWRGLSNNQLTNPWGNYDVSLNKYGKKVGTTLQFWEDKGWINPSHPYGWVQWYCDFFMGKRSEDDKRQIDRWMGLASENGRFRKWLVTQIKNKNGNYNDEHISPAIRQTLQHWGYVLTKADFDKELKMRKDKIKREKGEKIEKGQKVEKGQKDRKNKKTRKSPQKIKKRKKGKTYTVYKKTVKRKKIQK